MRIAYVTAGAGGMYCGSCLHDNTLAAALLARGVDILLIPTYTPIRTDEPDVSHRRLFFGGINVFLQQKLAFFRHTPWALDRILDARGLIQFVSRFALGTRAEKLGDLTISMLKGEHGHQRKEVDKLIHWLQHGVRPQLVNLTALLLSGMVQPIKRRLRVPVLCTLQGDDVFLEALPEPTRREALDLIHSHCRHVDGFIATSAYYADFMAEYVGIPRDRIHVVYPGINLAGHGAAAPGRPARSDAGPLTIGYFARISPEKGLHVLVEAFQILRKMEGTPLCHLAISGWLGENNRPYLADLKSQLTAAGLHGAVKHVESPDHASKVRFLQSLDILSVPTIYREPKGLYVLEALANGVPVVQPRHGSFPELIELTGGGILVKPGEPADLAHGLRLLLDNPGLRDEMGRKGRDAVRREFSAETMALHTMEVYRQYV
jgi:glycosyltransferase involved in cell wall biosynthesis